jgi:DNA-binding SARP family transcriptional activator
VYRVFLVSALAEGGQLEQAQQIVATSRALARDTYLEVMEVQLLLEEAYLCHLRGDVAGANSKLAMGFGMAASDRSRAAYAPRIAVRKPILLALALDAGIEVDFVRKLIRNWRIPPPADDAGNWPWPIKVRTLGTFELLLDETPVEFGRKTPKKTLGLLKAIVARGGSAPDSALIDAFWSDEEGDAAARQLAATVQRLRTLLGASDAVVQQGRQVSLDRSIVWVDAWTFERALGDARVEDALALYRGVFLSEDEGEAWPVATRERLRSKFIQAVADQGAKLEAERRDTEAITLYLRGLEADNVVEPFYQGLMRCYSRLDRLPEAASAYQRLKHALSVTLGLLPSAGTEKLYQALRLG